MSQSVKESVNRLVSQRRKRDPLPVLPAAPAIGAAVGYAQPQAPEQASTSAGVASPLREVYVDQRVYYPDQEEFDADGNPFIVNHIKKLYLQDANGNPFVIDSFGLPDPNNITIEA